MKYEKPVMQLVNLEALDIITLSVNNEYDPTINKTPGTPSDNPWAN